MPYLGQSPSKGDENNFKILDDISSYTLTFDGSDASVVSAANDTITSLNHRFVQGQRVTYNKGGGTVITGLSDGVYYIIKHDHHTIKLATSASNATNGIAVNITGVGGGSSHTLNVAFDGVNTKFKATHTNGQKTKITRSAQLVISINGVIQQPHDSATPSTGFGFDLDGTIVFSQAPVVGDIYWAHVLTNNNVTFDISDNDVDNFTGNGSTVSFNLSKTPPDNRNVLVTIDGVVQYPNDPDGTVRAYTVVENVLTFTTAPDSNVQIQVRHIGFAGSTSGSGGSGVTNFYGRTGSVTLINTDNIVANNAEFAGNLTVQGTMTTLDTKVTEVDQLEVAANNTTVGVAITQSGSGDILNLYDGSTEVFSVADGGNVSITGVTTIAHTGANQLTIKDSDTSGNGSSMRISFKDSGNTERFYIGNDESSNSYLYLGSPSGQNNNVALTVGGSTKLTAFSGGIGINGDLELQDTIYHAGDTDTKIRFPAADTFSVETAGSERLNLTASRLSLATNIRVNDYISHQSNDSLGVKFYNASGNNKYLGLGAEDDGTSTAHQTFKIYRQGSAVTRLLLDSSGNLKFDGADFIINDAIEHNHDPNTRIRFPANDTISFETSGNEALRIDSNGNIGVNCTPSTSGTLYDTVDHFLVIGDNDTGIAQDGDGQFEIWANQQEIINFSTAGLDPKKSILPNQAINIGQTSQPISHIYSTNITLDSSLIHNGDTDTLLEFGTNTISLETNGRERIYMTSDGKVGINTTTPYSALEIQGDGGTNDARITFTRHGSPSNGSIIGHNFYRIGTDSVAGFGAYRESAMDDAYLAFHTQPTGGSFGERLRITSDGQLAVKYFAHHTSSSGILNATATTSGRFAYKAIEIGSANGSGNDTGALVVGRRKAASSIPTALLGCWDDGSNVTLYHGGGWSGHSGSATIHHFYTDDYATGDGSGSVRLSIGSKGQIYLNNRDSNNSSHRGNIIAYAPTTGEFAYKAIEIGATNPTSNDNGGLIVAQRKGTTAYPFALMGSWDNGTVCNIYYGGGWQSQSANATHHKFYAGSYASSGGSGGSEVFKIDSSSVTVNNDLYVSDNIVHIGDTTCKIRFPSNDNIQFETAGSPRLNITTGGCVYSNNFGIGTNDRWKIRPNNSNADLTFEYSTSSSLADSNIKVEFKSSTLQMQLASDMKLNIGGTAGHCPLHVTTENTTYGKNAIFGSGGWVNNANYHYTDANISLLGQDADGNQKGAGVEFTARNTGGTNWLHGAVTFGRDGGLRLFNGGAGTTVGSERFRIASDGVIHINSPDSASGGRIWGNSSQLYLQSGNGRQTFKVSDAAAGVNRTYEITTDGHLKFPAGYGIEFSGGTPNAGSSPTVNSAVFDDYEEGKFIPKFLENGTTEASYAWQYGQYVKVAGIVHIRLAFGLNGFNSSGGNFTTGWIGGMPYTHASQWGNSDFAYIELHGYSWASGYGDSASSTGLFLELSQNADKFRIVHGNSKGNVNQSSIGTGQRFAVTFSYPVA